MFTEEILNGKLHLLWSEVASFKFNYKELLIIKFNYKLILTVHKLFEYEIWQNGLTL